jgi:hypothetical protein
VPGTVTTVPPGAQASPPPLSGTAARASAPGQ